jgi:hypothetical protein
LLFANCHFDNRKWFNISKLQKYESSKTLLKNLPKDLEMFSKKWNF